MTNIPPSLNLENIALAPDELRLVKTLRLLQQTDPATMHRIEEFVWSLVGGQLKWDFGDPASLDRAAAFAALDPAIQREVAAIQADFAATENDGLEEF